MKTYNFLYHTKTDIKQFMVCNKLDAYKQYLIRVHTALHSPHESVTIAKEISELFPNAKIAGVSAYAVIYNSIVYEKECLVSITDFDCAHVNIKMIDIKCRDSKEIIDDTFNFLKNKNVKMMAAFFTDRYTDIHFYIDQFNEKFPGVVMTGGIAGITSRSNDAQFVFNQEDFSFNSLMCVAVSGYKLKVYGNVMMSHETIGNVHTITKVNGQELLKIDNTDAVEWFKNFFGRDDLNSSKQKRSLAENIFFKFPLVLEDHNGASRFAVYSSEINKIINCYAIPEGTKFRMGYFSPLENVLECKKICSQLKDVPVETMFVYSCMLKRLGMHNCASWELTPFSKTDISGAFLTGEIGYIKGRNEFFNGTCSIVGMSENAQYINIDEKSFENMENLQDDNREILSYVLKMQNESIIKENRMLSQQIIEQEKITIKKVFMSEQSGLYEITKFFFDNEDKKFNKLCMISIEKGDVLRSYYGSNKFCLIIGESIKLALDFFGESDFNFYLYNSSTFVIAARSYYDRKKFQKLVRMFFLRHGSFYVNKIGITCLNDVSVVLDEYEGLIEKASSTMINAAKNGQRYRVYKSILQSSSKIEEEMKWVDIINDAIRNNRIVPYFQPIYDNTEYKVDKFEALMRIIGRNGEVYVPGQFMSIAKDYKLYTQISAQMLTKVFNLFSNRKEIVSVNISAYDINSDEMKKYIYERISQLKRPENFIFEIVESEELQNYDMMYEFVKKVSSYNIKIAIDDFGSGYSNLVEIAKLDPDYIKIDGEIIRNINNSAIHKNIAETVVYMADKLNVSLIAEYVENCELQKAVVDQRIEYSQGYLFSKPIPYEKIDKYLDSLI